MRYRLSLISSPELKNLVDDKDIPIRKNARILAALAMSYPEAISRRQLQALTWPGTETEVAANRLRVALTKWRQIFPSGLVESSAGLSLDAREVTCDLWEFQESIRQTQDAFDEKVELELLRAALTPWLGRQHELLQGLPSAKFWSDLHDAVCRAGNLGLQFDEPENMEGIAELGIKLFADNADTWAIYLRNQISLGDSERAWREFRQHASSKLANHSQIAEVEEWEKSSSATASEFEFSGSQRDIVMRVIETLVRSRTDLLRPVFSSSQTLGLSGAHPRAMMEVLQLLVNDTEEKDEHWERCMARIVGLKAWLNDARGVQVTAKILLAHTQNSRILRATWNAVAIAHSIVREWPEAMDAIDKTMEFAKETGDPIDVLATRGNRASFLWQMGDYSASDAEYAQVIAETRAIDSPRGEFEVTMGLGNHVFVPIMQNDWPRALAMLEECQERRKKSNIAMGLLLPALALVRIKMNQTDGVLIQLRQGLRENFATESDRSKQVAFEFSAGVLAATKQGALAHAVLEYTRLWRARTELPRCLAEIDFCSRISDGIPASQRRTTINPRTDPKAVGAEILRRLRLELS